MIREFYCKKCKKEILDKDTIYDFVEKNKGQLFCGFCKNKLHWIVSQDYMNYLAKK